MRSVFPEAGGGLSCLKDWPLPERLIYLDLELLWAFSMLMAPKKQIQNDDTKKTHTHTHKKTIFLLSNKSSDIIYSCMILILPLFLLCASVLADKNN